MFKIPAEKIKSNLDEFIQTMDSFGERSKDLRKLYESFGVERIALAPASSVNFHHNCFPGGYVDHVLRVVDFSRKNLKYYSHLGFDISGFTEKELLFAAFNHDLGKLGYPVENGSHYLTNDSEWHVKNQGKVYKKNPSIPFMKIPDRSIYLLQRFGVRISHNEYIAIQCHDGIYDESNKPYFSAYSPEDRPSNCMLEILHFADLMASRLENQREISFYKMVNHINIE